MIAHKCTCLDKTPLFVDGDTEAVYHETCEGFIADISDLPLTDSFWNEQMTDRNNAVVINGTHYRLGKPYPQKGYGFNGEHYRIKMLDDGAIVDTCDLWHQGELPEAYHYIMQDNAKFVRMIEVKQWLECPNCKQLMNRETCPFTNCNNENINVGVKIEVKNAK
jgi:hypothetical protein